jgi:DNA polymerase-3 subunit delta'
VVIDPADAMNFAASNSLLKILEEPPASVYFILVSSNPRRLLPTVRSRCRQMIFSIPDTDIAGDWLRSEGVAKPDHVLSLAGGAPLKALAIHHQGTVELFNELLLPLHRQPLEPVSLAGDWEALRKKQTDFLLEHLVDAVQKWLYDLTRVRNGGNPRYLPGLHKELAATAPKTSVLRLNRCYADLLRIRATARHPLNESLFLEDLASRCAVALAPPRS